jgi:hypothetical protein
MVIVRGSDLPLTKELESRMGDAHIFPLPSWSAHYFICGGSARQGVGNEGLYATAARKMF